MKNKYHNVFRLRRIAKDWLKFDNAKVINRTIDNLACVTRTSELLDRPKLGGVRISNLSPNLTSSSSIDIKAISLKGFTGSIYINNKPISKKVDGIKLTDNTICTVYSGANNSLYFYIRDSKKGPSYIFSILLKSMINLYTSFKNHRNYLDIFHGASYRIIRQGYLNAEFGIRQQTEEYRCLTIPGELI
ncbi:MAG: hypothetical protein AAGG51_19380 [Cyanobacteria bacterium P01_G01_bin.54]